MRKLRTNDAVKAVVIRLGLPMGVLGATFGAAIARMDHDVGMFLPLWVLLSATAGATFGFNAERFNRSFQDKQEADEDREDLERTVHFDKTDR